MVDFILFYFLKLTTSSVQLFNIIINNGLQVVRNIDLVYGGGSIGLMGLVSQAVYEGGRHVLGYTYLVLSSYYFLPKITVIFSLITYLLIFFSFFFFFFLPLILQSNSQDSHAKRGNYS